MYIKSKNNISKKFFLILATLIFITNSLSSSYATDFNDDTFEIKDITGGIKIINGIEYEMTEEEAQNEYKNSLTYEKYDEDEYELRFIEDFNIKTRRTYYGQKVRTSKIEYNQTKDPIKRTISDSYTFSSTSSGGISISNLQKKLSGSYSYSVSESASRSDSRTVTIRPGYKYYTEFQPRLIDVTGKVTKIGSHGAGISKDFKATMPFVLDNGELDGNIYYITNKI